jgi:hypothetical protein
LTSEIPLPQTAEAVLTFLESVGRRSEAELYLKLFRRLPKPSFALVAADYLVVRHALGSLVEHIEFLAQLGLAAPVSVGLFNPDSAERGARKLGEALPAKGIAVRSHDIDEPGLAAKLTHELSSGEWPVLKFSPRPGAHPRERFAELGRVARALSSRKVVVLRQRGPIVLREDSIAAPAGVVDDAGLLSVLNLRTDLETLLESNLLRQDDAKLAELAQVLLTEAGDPRLTVSVTSPLTLLRELFTVKGDGTLIKAGAEVKRVNSFAELDRERLRTLLERSFGRKLKPEFLARPPLAVYVEANYRGAAIVEPTPTAPYLTKFAVEPLAQGEGIGNDLWRALVRDHASVVWRARPSNPIGAWYASQCDGLQRLDRWHVFWRGLEPAAIPRAIEEALSRPGDFE